MHNKGMSLVEIIIVVAIMSILIGAAGFGVSLSSGKPAEECARKLVSSIENTRTSAMGRKATTLTISSNEDGVRVKEVAETLDSDGNVVLQTLMDEKVGSKGVSIEFSVGEEDTLSLSFDRASGALKYVNGEKAEGDVEIHIAKAGTKRKIVIYAFTGKVTVEAE